MKTYFRFQPVPMFAVNCGISRMDVGPNTGWCLLLPLWYRSATGYDAVTNTCQDCGWMKVLRLAVRTHYGSLIFHASIVDTRKPDDRIAWADPVDWYFKRHLRRYRNWRRVAKWERDRVGH